MEEGKTPKQTARDLQALRRRHFESIMFCNGLGNISEKRTSKQLIIVATKGRKETLPLQR